MLRRQPTSIKLTTQDLAAYDDAKRARDVEKAKGEEREALAAAAGSATGMLDSRLRARRREERLGLGGESTERAGR